MGLTEPRASPKVRTTDSEHGFPRYPNLLEGLEICRPDQVWVADITYVRLLVEELYLAILMDVYTRALRGWNLSRGQARNTPLRPGRAVRVRGICPGPWRGGADQHGAGGRGLAERLRGASHPHHQGGMHRAGGLPGLRRRASAHRHVSGGGLQPQAHPLRAGVSYPCGVRARIPRLSGPVLDSSSGAGHNPLGR